MKTKHIRFGIIAIGPSEEILHFCGYKKEPVKETFADLWRELDTDKEFGLVGKMKDVRLRLATQEQVEFFKKQIS